jgi:cytochrome P450
LATAKGWKKMTVWAATDNGHADLSNHDSFNNGLPLNTFSRMRREDPVAWCDYADGKGFWSITRHEDIMALNRDGAWMSSARGIRMEDQTYEEYLARRTFQETDAPDHTRVRRLVAKAFSQPVVMQFENQIRALCVDILDKAFANKEFDAVQDIARQLPMRMLGQIMGTPDEDLNWLVEKGDALMANSDSDFTSTVVDKMNTDAYRFMPFRSPAGAELFDYAERMMAERKKRGDESGILNMMLQPDAEGNVISESEFKNFFCLLVAAGNDTTRYSIAAGIHALANQPGLLADLHTDPNIWATLPDEVIRWASPATYFRRTATRDGEMHGKTIREGDKVLFWFASGNRDETAFQNPNTVDFRRTPNRHLAFGQGGAHVCLGIWLAKLEVRIVFQEIAKRLKSIEQIAPHAFVRSNFVGGIKRLPIRVSLN